MYIDKERSASVFKYSTVNYTLEISLSFCSDIKQIELLQEKNENGNISRIIMLASLGLLFYSDLNFG